MKKTKFLALIFSAVLGLSACGNTAENTPSDTLPPPITPESETEETTAEEPPETEETTSAEVTSEETSADAETEEAPPPEETSAEEDIISEETSAEETTTEETTAEEISGTDALSEDREDGENTCPLLLLVLYENAAWGSQQEVRLVAADGNCYNMDCYTDDLNTEKWFRFDDGWYDYLIALTETKSLGELPEEWVKNIVDFSENYEKYEGAAVKEYGNYNCDFGSYNMYGIYYDESGSPKYVRLCKYGDWVDCVDDKDVMDFANLMSEYGILNTMGFEYD